MNNEKRAAFTCAIQNMSNYLKLSGWVNIDWTTDETIFLWKDPLMGTPHRTDIAFMIQSDRDIYYEHDPRLSALMEVIESQKQTEDALLKKLSSKG